MVRTARSTLARCLGSAISKVNRLTATRSRLVVTDADRMFTCWSDRTLVTSDSSRVRSSASTWIATRNTEASLGAQWTGTMRSRWVSDRCSRLTQLARWTETPCPWVTKPEISSPGTGVQHLDSRTQTSATPSTSIPESLADRAGDAFGALGGIGVISARSSWAPAVPLTARTRRVTTDWALILPSPTAAYRPVRAG